jgi:mRNA-degrading endonuclease YafQ of YafQ-DinJ toxin-antitoxin module
VYTIEASQSFLRRAKKFFKKHPDLKKPFVEVVDDMRKDPFQPHLELHGLGGKLKDCYAVSLTYSYRITLTLLVTEKEIILLDIGSHDELYK